MHPDEILYHITIATHPLDLIKTRRGLMTYAEWIASEKARIEKKSGWPLAIYQHPGTAEVSLVHLRIPGQPLPPAQLTPPGEPTLPDGAARPTAP